MLTLNIQPRENIKNDALRAAGRVPGVYYYGGTEATAVSFNRNEFVRMYREGGESTVISLDTGSSQEQCLVQEVQIHPVSHEVLHVDFKIIEAGKKLEVTVPLEFVGVSPAVKSGLGTLTKALTEIEIEVLPKDLPHAIEVDISGLTELGVSIHAGDLKLPDGVTLLTDPESAVANIHALREEEEEEEQIDEIDFSAIEVEKKGKEESEDETE